METVRSREVYRNAWITVREDEVRREDGSPGLYGVVDKPDFALVIPADVNGFWLVEQYRYPVKRRAWEFPQGSWSPGATGSPLELAASELREETGLRADSFRHLGHLHQAYGTINSGFDVFLATGLHEGAPQRETSEQDMEHRLVPEAEFVEMIRDQRIADAGTVAAFGLLLLDRGR